MGAISFGGERTKAQEPKEPILRDRDANVATIGLEPIVMGLVLGVILDPFTVVSVASIGPSAVEAVKPALELPLAETSP
jgi:hypothetical protein